jgi:hypothetical protein
MPIRTPESEPAAWGILRLGRPHPKATLTLPPWSFPFPTVESIHATPGYRYETFLVVTTTAEAAAMLRDPHIRKYGMRELLPGPERLGTAIVVTRE